jgi:hypothetical protein
MKTPDSDEKKKFKVVIGDITDVAKEQAIDIGDERNTLKPIENPEEFKGLKKFGKKEFWSRFGKQIWRFGMARDYYRNKERNKAKKEIFKSGNIFIGEGLDKVAHEQFVSDLVDQFISDEEGVIHTKAGEVKREMKKGDREDKIIEDQVKYYLKEYASGRMTKDALKEIEKRIFYSLKEDTDQQKLRKKNMTMYFSNLEKIGDQMKLMIHNKEFLENEDFELDLIYGKSKAGARTEANFTKIEKLADKLSKTKLGAWVNETNTSIIMSIAFGLGRQAITSGAGLALRLIPFVGTGLTAAGIAKIRESKKFEEERKAEAREKTQGKTINEKIMPRRKEMRSFTYESIPAGDTTKAIEKIVSRFENNDPTLTDRDVTTILNAISGIKARIVLSDINKIDLVGYSHKTKMVKERKELDQALSKIKDSIEKSYSSRGIAIPQIIVNGARKNQTFDEYLESLTKTQENVLLNDPKGDIATKDKKFKGEKKRRSNKAARRAAIYGAITGVVLQEAWSGITLGLENAGLYPQHRIGIFEDLFSKDALQGAHGLQTMTFPTYLKHLLQGDFPKIGSGGMHEVIIGKNHFNIPNGTELVKNGDGYDFMYGDKVLAKHITFNPNGTLTNDAVETLRNNGILNKLDVFEHIEKQRVPVDEWVDQNSDKMTEAGGRKWYWNNTVEFDKNELRGWWGGENYTGIDAKGNYDLEISHMLKNWSYGEGLPEIDPIQLMKEGKLRLLVSMSRGTQNHFFEVPYSTTGHTSIPPGVDAGIAFGTGADGIADFHGGFAEVAYKMPDGRWGILATLPGDGALSDIETLVHSLRPETSLDVLVNYATDVPPIISPDKRNPTETLKEHGYAGDGVIEKKATGLEDFAITPAFIPPSSPASTPAPIVSGGFRATPIPTPVVEPIDGLSGVDIIPDKNGGPDGEILDYDSFYADTIIKQKLEDIDTIQAEEYDNLRHDLELINKAKQKSKGVYDFDEKDFKSEYGKKSFNELKQMPEGMDKGILFNPVTVLSDIGDEIEAILSPKKGKTEAELAQEKKERQKNLQSDIEMINKAVQKSKGVYDFDEKDFKSEFGKKRFNELKQMPDEEKPREFNPVEVLSGIGSEIEGILSAE